MNKKNKVEEEKFRVEDDKKILTKRLEEKTSWVTRISNMKSETLGQMMIENHELNVKDIEITRLKLQNKQKRNDLKREKEFIDSFNKPSDTLNNG